MTDEMTSIIWWGMLIATILTIPLSSWLAHQRLHKKGGHANTAGRLPELDDDDPVRSNHLGLMLNRTRLSSLLSRNYITGDANIREGKVYPVVDPVRVHPIMTLLEGAANRVARLPNPSASVIYMRDPETGRYEPLGSIDAEDFREIVELLRPVAEAEKNKESEG